MLAAHILQGNGRWQMEMTYTTLCLALYSWPLFYRALYSPFWWILPAEQIDFYVEKKLNHSEDARYKIRPAVLFYSHIRLPV